MDLMLVTGCRRFSDLPAKTAADAELQAAWMASGHTVRWLLPVATRGSRPEVEPSIGGALWTELPVIERGFRNVQDRLVDPRFERTFSCMVRQKPPDVVFLTDYGGHVPWALPWIATRLGTRIVVAADPASVLCHRGTLVHAVGTPCAVFDDPERCTNCCLTSTPDGLTKGQARLASVLRIFSGFSPFPSAQQFENRLEMVAHGLAQSAAVLVEDDAAAGLFASSGVPKRVLRIVPVEEREPLALLSLFEGLSMERAR